MQRTRYEAAKRGQTESAQLLLEAGADVNKCSMTGHPFGGGEEAEPLSVACQQGHEDVVALLLEAAARVESGRLFELLPLGWASVTGRPDIICQLLEARAYVGNAGKSSLPPLLIAAGLGHLDAARVLLEGKATVDTCSEGTWAALEEL